jgi:uncharacterized membrane protein
MLSTVTVTETHLRTLTKAAIYRVFSTVNAVLLALLIGGTLTQAISFGLIALISGAIHYYLYDRLWLFINWHRNDQGKDTNWRSITKAIIYRITAWIILILLARTFVADSDAMAILLASLKFITNAIAYYLLERLFNWIEWGKVKPVEVDTSIT